MAGRPGLYQELAKHNLLREAWDLIHLPWTDAARADWLDMMLEEDGSNFSVSARAVSILRHRLLQEGQPADPPPAPKRKPNSGSFKPGNPGGPGAPLGNHNATITGVGADPFIHTPEDVEYWSERHRWNTPEVQRHAIRMYDQRLSRIKKMQSPTKTRIKQLRAELARQEQHLTDIVEAIEITEERRDRAAARLREMEPQEGCGDPGQSE